MSTGSRSFILVALALVGCKAGPATTSSPCPGTFKQLGSADATCRCDATSPQGSVWGVDTYTQDSSLCAAAIHAGVIGASGGDIHVKAGAGCAAFSGSTRNGITSGSWGNYPDSFYFVGKGNGTCQTQAAEAPVGPCAASFKEIPGVSASTELTCECAATPTSAVWGAGIYTQDSSICGAAIHAGVIPASGGRVKVKAAPGCAKYVSTAQNGITSGSWGPYGASFYFPSSGDGHCAS